MSCADAWYAVGALGCGVLVFQLLQTRSGGVDTACMRVMVNFGPELMTLVRMLDYELSLARLSDHPIGSRFAPIEASIFDGVATRNFENSWFLAGTFWREHFGGNPGLARYFVGPDSS